jgi:hypothetical protein
MQVLAVVVYFGLGLLQLAATIAGLEEWIGLHWLIAVPVALFIAYFPLLGTVIGMLGAVAAWGWSWLAAFALFFGPFLVVVILTLLAGGIGALVGKVWVVHPGS